MELNAFVADVHKTAVEHGWWDNNPSFADTAVMCHAEISEAVDEYRNGMPMAYVMKRTCGECPDYSAGAPYMETDMTKWTPNDKPEGIAVELADCVLRIMDWFGAQGIDLEAVLQLKNAYNKTREYRHGGKVL